MNKYYVVCGNMRWVGHARTPKQAAVLAIKDTEKLEPKLGTLFYVDSRGFRTNSPLGYSFDDLLLLNEDDAGKAAHFYDTEEILMEAGWEIE